MVLNHESDEWIQFINPGDLRVADKACGDCHGDITKRVGNSMMNHGGMLWNAAAYNNGSIHLKNTIVGQAYGKDGVALVPRGSGLFHDRQAPRRYRHAVTD